jgi:hypothetical protein
MQWGVRGAITVGAQISALVDSVVHGAACRAVEGSLAVGARGEGCSICLNLNHERQHNNHMLWHCTPPHREITAPRDS